MGPETGLHWCSDRWKVASIAKQAVPQHSVHSSCMGRHGVSSSLKRPMCSGSVIPGYHRHTHELVGPPPGPCGGSCPGRPTQPPKHDRGVLDPLPNGRCTRSQGTSSRRGPNGQPHRAHRAQGRCRDGRCPLCGERPGAFPVPEAPAVSVYIPVVVMAVSGKRLKLLNLPWAPPHHVGTFGLPPVGLPSRAR